MRIIYMGTPDISVPALLRLIEYHDVVAVVTQPDRPKGRGRQMQYSPVKEEAVRHGIPVLQPVKARDPEFVAEIAALEPDLIVVMAFGQILKRDLLELPRYGCINIHASLLPMYRGASPINQVIIDGCEETGVTTMMMDEGLDTGDILLKRSVKIGNDDTAGSLHDKLAALGADVIIDTIAALEAGTLTRTPQQGESSYAGMITKEMGEIDWTQPAQVIERRMRGLDPWPGAYTEIEGRRLKIFSASIVEDYSDAAPGTVLKAHKDTLTVKCGSGALTLGRVQAEGKKAMTAGEYMRGNAVTEGTVLGKS